MCATGQHASQRPGAGTARTRTFVHVDDVRVAERRHDLDLALDLRQVVRLADLTLPDRLDGVLQKEREKGELGRATPSKLS